MSSYVLLTAAKNEADYIGETIASVMRQTIRPSAWFIVDDGSTDKTAQIVRRFASPHSFIKLLSSGTTSERCFSSKAKAINAAYKQAHKLQFEFVGILDADIAFERDDYYESMLRAFQEETRLGILGGYIYEKTDGFWKVRKSNSEDSVAGAMQLFRRVCYEKIGGYVPMPLGGVDWLPMISVRMAGWEVVALPEFHVFHFRPTSTASGRWRGLFQLGMMDASFGSHPAFELFKCARRVLEPPMLVGSVVRFAGFASWILSGKEPLLSPEHVAFLRREQIAKIRNKTRQLAGRRVIDSRKFSV